MHGKSIKESKNFQKILKDKGYTLSRISGSHYIYTKGALTISVPYKLNSMIQRRLRKEITYQNRI